MSKGPGRIERAIRELFDTSPDRAFLTADLANHCFSGADWIERKHEVSVLRAARKIVASDPDWRSWRTDRGSIFFNHGNLQSYALFDIIRSEGRIWLPSGGLEYANGFGYGVAISTSAAIEAVTNDPHCRSTMTPPDGKCWRAVQQHCAERDGDTATATALKTRADSENAAEMAGFLASLNKLQRRPAGMMVTTHAALNEQLMAAAAQLRDLAKQNDPDAVREGLAVIAGQLETLGGCVE
jgi:hypothetical protein